jgi:hypothetical protein
MSRSVKDPVNIEGAVTGGKEGRAIPEIEIKVM